MHKMLGMILSYNAPRDSLAMERDILSMKDSEALLDGMQFLWLQTKACKFFWHVCVRLHNSSKMLSTSIWWLPNPQKWANLCAESSKHVMESHCLHTLGSMYVGDAFSGFEITAWLPHPEILRIQLAPLPHVGERRENLRFEL